MEEESVRKGAIRTAKWSRAILILLGAVIILAPILVYLLGGDKKEPLQLETILLIGEKYFLPGLLMILVGEYLYYHLVTQAFTAYNSRRMTDSCDVIESGVHRMAGLGYGQNVRGAEPVNPQPINMQGTNLR